MSVVTFHQIAQSTQFGYIFDGKDGSEPAVVSCFPGWLATSTTWSSLMGYEQPRSTDIGVSIDDEGLHYTRFTTDQFGSSTSNMSVRTCETYVSIDIVETWPSGGDTWTLFDCFEFLYGMRASVSTLYRTVDVKLTRAASSESTTAAESTTTESTTTEFTSSETTTTISSDTTTTTSSPTQSTTSTGSRDPNDENRDNSKGNGPSAGVIAGAAVGGAAAVGILGAAVWIGIRIGRKKTAAGNASGDVLPTSKDPPEQINRELDPRPRDPPVELPTAQYPYRGYGN